MIKRKRRHYTDAEKAEMWNRWRKGESMNEIGRLFGIQGHSSIHTGAASSLSASNKRNSSYESAIA